MEMLGRVYLCKFDSCLSFCYRSFKVKIKNPVRENRHRVQVLRVLVWGPKPVPEVPRKSFKDIIMGLFNVPSKA